MGQSERPAVTERTSEESRRRVVAVGHLAIAVKAKRNLIAKTIET